MENAPSEGPAATARRLHVSPPPAVRKKTSSGFPWKAIIIVLVVLCLVGSVLVTMWPGLRKAHSTRQALSDPYGPVPSAVA